MCGEYSFNVQACTTNFMLLDLWAGLSQFRSFQSGTFPHFPSGLDAAGKTTVLYKLKLGEVVTTIPTIGEYASHVKIWLDSEATFPASRKPIICVCLDMQVHKLMYETVKAAAVALFPGFSAGAWMLRLSMQASVQRMHKLALGPHTYVHRASNSFSGCMGGEKTAWYPSFVHAHPIRKKPRNPCFLL